MLYFESDYTEGAHESVLQRLIETNMEQMSGYGNDRYCMSAKEKIKAYCACPQAEVHFLVGGTQTNQTVLASLLQSYEGVIAATTGHINAHEAGAVELTGHKVLALPQENGKLNAAVVEKYLSAFFSDENRDHMVFPGAVYISHPTEYGTLYTKAELSALYDVCKVYGLPLFLDGARLGYGLESKKSDMSIADIARLCDVFYIGGTKVGALCGEAVVFTHGNTPKQFMTIVKQHGALLAKGRLLGVQFDALFTDDLYFKISRHANRMADKLRSAFAEKGYKFLIDTPTNQIFIVLENNQLAALQKQVVVSFWEKVDDSHTAVRFATSWATNESDVDALIALL